MKGYILTMEAFLSLMVVILLITSLPMLFGKQENDFDSFLLLADSFEVLERGYHDELAIWIDTGIAVSGLGLSNYFDFLEQETGQKMFLSFDGREFPDYGCDAGMSMRRLVVTNTGAHNKVIFSLCK
jgi:hypothetical protein